MNKRRRFKTKRAQSSKKLLRFLNARRRYWNRRGYQVISYDDIRDLGRRLFS